MKRIGSILIIIALMVPQAGLAQEVPSFDKEAFIASSGIKKTLDLGLVDCVAMALKNNSEINVKRIDPRIEDTNILIQKAKFEPELSFDFTMEDNTELSPTTLTGTGALKTRTGTFDFGYDQTLVTGTEIAVDFYNTRTWSNSLIQALNPEFDSAAAITVTQPLLKGFGIVVNKADFLIAKNNRQKSDKDFVQEVIRVLTEVKRSYYNFQYSQEQYKTAETSLARVNSLYEINKERYAKGLASDVDLLQSEADVARAEEMLAAAEGILKAAEDGLKFITNLVDDPEYWNAAITLLEGIVYEKREVELPVSLRDAFNYRPDYEAAKIDLRSKDISVVYYKNNLLPTMDLVGTYGLNGLAKTYEKDLGHIGGGHYPDWSVGVSVKVPFFNDEEKGKYQKATLDKEKALISFSRLEQKIILEVRDAVRETDIKYKMLESSIKVKAAEQKNYAAQVERFKAGLVSTNDMIDYQDRLTRAEVNFIKSVVDYNISLIDLAKAKGTTLVDDHITIE